MRTANICPTCATYENALCVLYNGVYLTNTKISPLDSLQVALAKINANLVPLTGIIAPAFNATYLGQQYLNTVTKQLYYAKSVGAGVSDWTLSVNGTPGQVGFFGTTYNVIGDNGLFWDNTNKRLGVGTTTPAYKLDVAGNGRFTSSVIGTYFQNTGQNAFYLTNAGNNDFTLTGSGVFRILNNTQLTSLFSVTNTGLATFVSNVNAANFNTVGNIVTGGDSIFNEVRVGKGAGNLNSNTVVGQYALSTNTTGYQNTVLGFTAMQLNGAGYQNTAVGAYALAANTSGNGNTAVGDYALTLNGTGIDNVAIGKDALRAATAALRCVAIGEEAMYSATTAVQNVSVGYKSLFAGGSYNVSVGYQSGNGGQASTSIGFESLHDNTGLYNTAVGYRSLYVNSTGQFNTALGYRALQANQTGLRNTSLGGQSLYNATGSYNIGIGYDAGRYVTVDGGAANTGSTSCIYIGYKSLAATATDTNAIVIGNGALSLGSNTTVIGNSSTTKTVIRGNVLIDNTLSFTSNTAKLEVTGSIASSTLTDATNERFVYANINGKLIYSNVYAISSDQLLINGGGTTGAIAALEVNVGNAEANLALMGNFSGYNLMEGYQGPGNQTIYIQELGDVYNLSGTYGTISDARLKENIIPATSKLDELMKVNIVNYNLIADERKLKQIGVIAQEIEEIFPGLVATDKEDNKSVKASVFIPMLIKGMQEQQDIIKNLQTQIDELKSKIQ